jgi:hypothetical protein
MYGNLARERLLVCPPEILAEAMGKAVRKSDSIGLRSIRKQPT